MTWHGTARQGKDFESAFGKARPGGAGLGKAGIFKD
jgi:hypothetical protein